MCCKSRSVSKAETGWVLVKCSDEFRAQHYDWHSHELALIVILWLKNSCQLKKLQQVFFVNEIPDCIFHNKHFLFCNQNFKLQVFLILRLGIFIVIPMSCYFFHPLSDIKVLVGVISGG